jgi:cellulose synthase/poly-beta-1,6-N-acetylglucosamine synthase-like glycosyltransferase
VPAPREPAAPVVDQCTEHGDIVPYCAPPGLVVKRPRWVGPALLLSFVGAALAIHLTLRQLTYDYGQVVGKLADVHRFALPKQASIAVRPFTVALLLAFAACAAGSVRARIRLALIALGIYLPVMIVVDVILARLARQGGLSPFMTRGNIIDGIIGILAACLAVFWAARLPADLYLDPVVKRPIRYLVILVLSLAATVAAIAGLFHLESRWLHKLAAVPLFGGLLSVVVLFLVSFPVFLLLFGYLAGLLLPRPSSMGRHAELVSPNGNGKVSSNGRAATRAEARAVPAAFGFLVPAHNEEGRIGDCIRAIDSCAGESAARVTVYVVENGSTDGTYEEAREALDQCLYARGVLLTSSTELKSRAKAHALNTGLAAATEPVIVRVDADTFVSRGMLNRMAPYFSDPQVGGVGTVPLPHKVTIWIERMRTLEVYYGAAFKRTAQGAVDAIPVLPGATVAFRRELLVRLGGFSEGILGEDSDITVRVGRLGYQIVSDPAIRVYSEQPQNFRELREQRMRWSCGLFHMIGHNRSAIFRVQGLRGVWTLPWACFVMFRKLMLIPFAIAALALILVGHSLFPLREIAAAGAITLGAQLIGMAIVVLILAGPANIISLPSYIVFRLIVTYFALETLFTVALREPRSRLPAPLALRSGGRGAA